MARKKPVQRGIMSIERGGRIVEALSRSAAPMSLTTLSSEAGMAASKAHRYLVSLIRTGLIEQLSDGSYDLGALALSAGLAKLARLDSYQLGLAHLEELRRISGETVLMAVWNGQSVVAVRWLESGRPVNVYVRPGSFLPTLNSASGRLFAAFLPAATAAAAIEREFQMGVTPTSDGKKLSREEFAATIDGIRRRGMSRVRGDLTQGIDAISAPIFNLHNQIEFAFSIVGPSGSFDASWNSKAADLLRQITAKCSKSLGASFVNSEAVA